VIARRLLILLILSGALAAPATAEADFGIVPGSTSVTATNEDGSVTTQASSHPFGYSVHFALNTEMAGNPEGGELRDAFVDLPPGLIGNPAAVPQCRRILLENVLPECPTASQVGVVRATVVRLGEIRAPIYNMTPPPGVAAQFAFSVAGSTSLEYASVQSEQDYGLSVAAPNIPTPITAVTETIWGTPAETGHDPERTCYDSIGNVFEGCSSDAPLSAYLTLPASCGGAPQTTVRVDSKLTPGIFSSETVQALDLGGNPAPMSGCDGVPFAPKVAAQPSTKLAENPSGLNFELKLPNQGLLSPGGIVETEPSKVRFALPEGVTVNPSFADGIVGCSPAEYAAEQIDTAPGAGCPEASKLGSVVVRTPLLEESLEGSLYLANPHDNPFDSLAALYLVARAPERGVLVKQAGKIELDQATGQIVTTFEGLPPIPFSSFQLRFREGGRAPLATPAACGEYKSLAELFPFSRPSEATALSASFQIEHGADGGACPSGGVPPFHPGLEAGSINNAAGAYSPFYVRISRTDSEQEITHFSIKLPPGVTGKLAGIPFCGDASIAAAKAREGTQHGGQEELERPSCSSASEIGHTLVGAGVGSSLTYIPGKVYLAGPYKGSNLSIVAITAAKAGPFDLGTVVIREAIRVNPETAEVSVDAAGSDPIPHIIDGVPVHLRDIRVYVDRPQFTLNPTSCKRTSTASTVLGSGANFASEADDQPITVTSPFQAADCASLGFAPKIVLTLRGGTKRNANPAFKAIVTPRRRDANIGQATVTLPHSEFLDNEHIKTICTRVQFNAGGGNGEQCPAASVYGRATATTPLLDEALSGPVYLRSSSHKLPDLVAALHSGEINIDLDGRIDSAKGGRIRNTFEAVPDAPVSKFTLEMFGGKRSLLVNSTDICKGTHKAIAEFNGQNGKLASSNPPLKAQCGKKSKGKKGKGKKAKKKGAGSSALGLFDGVW
jgi:hypothetical protein